MFRPRINLDNRDRNSIKKVIAKKDGVISGKIKNANVFIHKGETERRENNCSNFKEKDLVEALKSLFFWGGGLVQKLGVVLL